ncbi:hypothetical protein ACFJIV_05800 [Mucilaginibacter sp. UC70_90]
MKIYYTWDDDGGKPVVALAINTALLRLEKEQLVERINFGVLFSINNLTCN